MNEHLKNSFRDPKSCRFLLVFIQPREQEIPVSIFTAQQPRHQLRHDLIGAGIVNDPDGRKIKGNNGTFWLVCHIALDPRPDLLTRRPRHEVSGAVAEFFLQERIEVVFSHFIELRFQTVCSCTASQVCVSETKDIV